MVEVRGLAQKRVLVPVFGRGERTEHREEVGQRVAFHAAPRFALSLAAITAGVAFARTNASATGGHTLFPQS